MLAPVCCYVRYPGEAPFLSGAIRFVAVVLRIVRMARMRVDYFVLSNCFGAVRFIPANEGIDSVRIPFYSKTIPTEAPSGKRVVMPGPCP